ncbi:MAG: GNAT family N-acetyltransferase [Planctomycetes bacterium]|nr:GNAT family N-acetyltransferase [Planctomycetota bacterium]
MSESGAFTIRAARIEDCELLMQLIGQLAEFERLAHTVTATVDGLRAAMFGPRPAAEAVIAERAGEALGFALFFQTFSTFRGRVGFYLEDLFVREAFRGQGVGRALLLHLAREAHRRGAGRMEWAALDWNQRAIDFYTALGAEPLDDWTVFRLTDEKIAQLAGQEAASG